MRLKKYLTMFLLCVFTVCLIGCAADKGGSEDENLKVEEGGSEDENLKAEEKALTIGFSNTNFATPWRVALGEQLQDAIEELAPNWEVITTDAQSNSAKQIADIEDLIAKDVDLIIMSPYQSEPLSVVSKQCIDAGIPLVLVDRLISTEDYTAFVGGDNVDAGIKAAEMILDITGGKGEIGVVQGTYGSSAQIDRNEGFHSIIDEYEDLSIVADTDGNFQRDLGLTQTEDIITSNPNVKALYYQSSNSALGGLQALEAANRTDVQIVSTDGSKEEMDLIKEGKIASTIIYPTGAREAVEVAIKILNGDSFEKYDKLETILVTKENVEQYYYLGY